MTSCCSANGGIEVLLSLINTSLSPNTPSPSTCYGANSNVKVLSFLNRSSPSRCCSTKSGVEVLSSSNVSTPSTFIERLALIAFSSDLE